MIKSSVRRWPVEEERDVICSMNETQRHDKDYIISLKKLSSNVKLCEENINKRSVDNKMPKILENKNI